MEIQMRCDWVGLYNQRERKCNQASLTRRPTSYKASKLYASHLLLQGRGEVGSMQIEVCCIGH